jgi:hypothetical protein
MASERDLELLDDYISNRLNAQERSAFEQKLEGDPELKSEFQLQNKIADGIRQARAAELKAMLGAIPTTGLPTGGEGQLSIPAKIGMWVAATAVVGTGIYFYLTSHETAEQPKNNETVQAPEVTKPEDSAVQAQPADSETVATAPEDKRPVTEESAKPAVKKADSAKTKKTDSSQVEPSGKPSINAFDPSEETDEQGINQADVENIGKASAADMPVVYDNTNKKYKFHYQIKDGKLTLYGPFEKNLYELMAFYSGTKVTRFLYHENKYYLLSDENDKIKILTPINDPKLIDKLNKSRQKEN